MPLGGSKGNTEACSHGGDKIERKKEKKRRNKVSGPKRVMAKTAKIVALGHLDGSNAETELTVKAILIASQRIEQVFLRMPKAAR